MTPSIWTEHLVEVYLVYGLSFVLMGITALLQPSDSDDLPISRHFWLLGSFGLLHGGKEFLDAWAVATNAAGLTVNLVGSSLLMVSFAFLFELARRAATDYARETGAPWALLVSAWVYVPVILMVLLLAGIATDFTLGLSAGARYLLGFPAAVLTGLLLRRAFRHSSVSAGILGIAFVAYGLFGGLITERVPGFPTWIPTEVTFLEAIGIPVQGLRTICALAAMLSLALLTRGSARTVVARLRESAAQIQDLANSLERRVEERTADLQESEARLRGVMDNAGDAIITIDERGLIDSFNQAASLMFGFTGSEILGKNASVLMPEPHRSRHDEYINRYLETGEARIIGIGLRELTAQHKGGQEFPIELSVTEFLSRGHRAFIGSIRDISVRKEVQRQLQQAQKIEAIGQLTGGVAHDFNNLLTTIVGNLDLLRDHFTDDEDAQRFTESALRASYRGADLTHRLLAFSRRQPLEPKPVNVNKCVMGAAELMRRTLGEDVEIETVLGGGVWDAMIDESQLENAMLNLAINSRDAMPGGGKLTIETANGHLDREYASQRSEVALGQYVVVTFSDTGSGMPPEVLERAFEPFYTTKEVGKGTGLGLSMIYGFIKQSGGHVAIYSEPDEGTSVKLYLPRATGEEARTYPPPASQQIAMPTGDETILVVEDDPDVRTFVVSALGVLGYAILEAEDGPSALALMEQARKVDLLFTDIVLPSGMNGRELADEIQRRDPEIKVLFTSGYTENAIVHHGRLDADAQLVPKPYDRRTLALRIRTALDE